MYNNSNIPPHSKTQVQSANHSRQSSAHQAAGPQYVVQAGQKKNISMVAKRQLNYNNVSKFDSINQQMLGPPSLVAPAKMTVGSNNPSRRTSQKSGKANLQVPMTH